MHPIFKKLDKFVDGKLCEVFYIDDKEVSESTYYTLLESNYDESCNMNYDVKENRLFQDETEENKALYDEWVRKMIHYIKHSDDDNAFELLSFELNYYYCYGYYIGQILTNERYIESMKKNLEDASQFLDELIKK